MNKWTIKATLLAVVFVFSTNSSHSQQATEVYIPIGKSPGVSVTSSLHGKISGLDYETRSIRLVDRGSVKSVQVNDATRYYLDRSKYEKTSEMGTMHDCKVGRMIEVNVTDDGDVKWIKIEVD